MAETSTDIANQALGHLGESTPIVDLTDTNDTSKNTVAIRRVYDDLLKVVLRKDNWKFSTRFEDLLLLVPNPTSEWAHGYKYPDNCLKIRRILNRRVEDRKSTSVPHIITTRPSSGTKPFSWRTVQTPTSLTCENHGLSVGDAVTVNWLVAYTGQEFNVAVNYFVSAVTVETFTLMNWDGTPAEPGDDAHPEWGDYQDGGTFQKKASTLVLTNFPEAKVETSALITDVSLYPADFVRYFSFKLAAEAGPNIVGPDRMDLVTNAKQNAMEARADALASGWIEVEKGERPVSKYQAARRPRWMGW